MVNERAGGVICWSTMFMIVLCAASAAAQLTDPTANQLPPQFSGVAIEQRLNHQVPLQLSFRDDTGRPVQLQDYFHSGKPVILSLVYFKCPMLCSQVLSSMASALRQLKFDPGKEFEVLSVSFDPREGPDTAAITKAKYLKMYGRSGAEQGWHFLTGDKSAIAALAEAVGFHYQWDARTQQFAHATGIMLLTPEGHVAQYYYGARYFPTDLRLGLVQASQNRIGTVADQIVLYCYHYDPRTGRYGAIVSRVIQVAGALTLAIMGAVFLILWRADPTRR